jgi:hypothetical protein
MIDTERREFSRVDAYISLHTRVVPEDQRHNLQSRSSAEPALSHFQPLPVLEDTALSESIRTINSKLDAILNILMFHDKDFYCLKTGQVNISGSGLSFDSKEQCELGQLMELKLVFPETPEVMLCVYGEVMKCERNESGDFQISVRFTVIDEEIRDKIIKYVFDKQREILRKSRRQ